MKEKSENLISNENQLSFAADKICEILSIGIGISSSLPSFILSEILASTISSNLMSTNNGIIEKNWWQNLHCDNALHVKCSYIHSIFR